MSKFSIKASVSDLPDIETVNKVISELIKEHIDNDELVNALVSLSDVTKEEIANTVIVDFQRYMKEIFQYGCTVYKKDYFKKAYAEDGCKSFPVIRKNIVNKTFPKGIKSVDEYIQSIDDECTEEREMVETVTNVVSTLNGIFLNIDTNDKDRFKPLIKDRLKREKYFHFSEDSVNEKIAYEIEYNFVHFEDYYQKEKQVSKKNIAPI